MEKAKIIILGAGYSGLAAAALLSKRGHDVCLLEAHSLPGGCASFFQRGPYRFDVGATTLSGMAFNGPLKKLYDQLELQTPLIKQAIGMEIHLDHLKLKRFADHSLWMEQLHAAFPQLNCHPSWNRFKKWNEMSWKTLPHLTSFPASSLRDFIALPWQAGFKGLALAPALLQSVHTSLSQQEKNNLTYKRFIDEQLLISTQAHSNQVNALVGSLGLIYPSDTYYPQGGMAALAQELVSVLKKNGARIFFKQEVVEIKKQGPKFIISTQKGREFESSILLSTIPGWNHLKIGPPEINDDMKRFNQRYPQAWGAMVGYFAVKLKKAPSSQYFQIHTTHHHLRLQEMKSLFFSLSHPTDQSRAPSGFQTVTVSTHCLDGQTLQRESSEYNDLKSTFQAHILEIFKEHFKDYEIEEITTPEVATPLSFEHYTKRLHGRVGGLAHGNIWDLLCYPGQETQVSGLYRFGDTVFPGQGVVGVIAGAQKLVEKISHKGLL